MRARLLLLLLGVLIGVGAAQLGSRFWHRLAPAALRGAPTAGVVESKRWDDERLLLTLVTDSGAVLASFSRQAAEIDLLIEVGDTVELGLRRYRPFVDDPEIDRVVKAGAAAAAPGARPEPPPPPAAADPAAPPAAAPPPPEEPPPPAAAPPG